MYDLQDGTGNIALGVQAMKGGATTGQKPEFNVMVGWGAGSGQSTIKTPTYNVGVGYLALQKLVDQDHSVGIGYHAGRYATGSYNTFLGSEAGKGGTTSAPFSSGQYNIAVGIKVSLADCVIVIL